jgi:predicted ribosome quality control (RQC) complex YloA/Tae2 family protein
MNARQQLVQTDEIALFQETGVYRYRHPLSDAVAYQKELQAIEDESKEMNRRDGGAVLAAQQWTVNGSEADGRKMVRDFSKLMLRAFNAEADNLVRGLKPYKLDAAIDRLRKVATTIEKLGKTMSIRISTPYEQLRVRELEVTADFLAKQAEEREAERLERVRLKEERRAQQEMERERARLEKERQHFQNALLVLVAKGDTEGADRLQSQLADVQRAIEDVDYRAANVRAGATST